LIKVAIAKYALEYEQKNPNYIDERISIDESEIVHGAGIIRGLTDRKWSIRDLIYLMLNVSDNTATNALIDYFSLDKLLNWSLEDYNGVVIGRYMMKLSSQENIINLSEFLPIWGRLFSKDTKLSKVIVDALRHQQNKVKLEGKLSKIPFTGKTFNKTGELLNEEHDISRFEIDGKWIDCAVLTHFRSEGQRFEAIEFNQNIGLIVGDYLQLSN